MTYPARSLRELEARFVRLEILTETRRRVRPEVWAVNKTGPYADGDLYDWTGPVEYHVDVDAIAEADGVAFLCPKCFEDPPVGSVGTHSILCWSPKVSQDYSPRPGRWNLVGTSIDDLELVAGSSSVQIQGGCNAHFFVRKGRIVPA